MKLGKGESLVKQYNCYNTSDGQSEVLTVTNRRVIATHVDRLGKAHEEMRIEDIKSVTTGFGKRKITFLKVGIYFLIMGLLVVLAGILIANTDESALIPFVIMGVFLMVMGLIFLLIKQEMAQFYLYISTNIGEGRSINSNVSTGAIGSTNKKRKKGGVIAGGGQKNIKIVIDQAMCRGIIDELGSILFDLQIKPQEEDKKEIV